jgi:hypothetical protein
MQILPTKGDKSVRAQSIRGRLAVSGLRARGRAVAARPHARLPLVPACKHDDICDALGLIGQLLDRMTPGREPAPPKKQLVLSTRSGKL